MEPDDLLEIIRQQLEAMMGFNNGLAPLADKDGVVRIDITVSAPLEMSPADLANRTVQDALNDLETQIWLQQSWDMPAYEKPTR